MKLVATKLEMESVGKMSKLVIENIDAIASDLTVLDSRLLLGNASIDVVALDATGSLVLVAIDRTSDEQLLLKAVEAYSWCLEYPEAVRRLYPAAEVSVSRPPRVMFVVERMSDAFHRKVKQLGFPEVDCVEFRHLAIDGAEAVHFDTVVRLRRAALVAEDTRSATPVSTPAPSHDNAAPAARATSVKLQRLLNADAPAASTPGHAEPPVERPLAERPTASTTPSAAARESGVVVSMVNRAGRHAATRHDELAVTRRPVRDAHLAEPVGSITLEPAAVVALAPEPVAGPQVALPEPVFSVAPVLEPIVDPEPISAPVLESAAPPHPIRSAEPTVTAAAVSELAVESPIVAEPVVAVVRAPEPVAVAAAPEPMVVAPAAEPVTAVVPTPEPVGHVPPAPEPVIAVVPAPEPIAVVPEVAMIEPEPNVAPEPAVAIRPVSEVIAEPEPVTAPEPAVAALPVSEPIAATAASEPPRISFADLSKELLAAQSVERKAVSASKPVVPTRPVEPVVSIKPAAAASSQRVSLADLSKELLGAAASVRTPHTNGPTPLRLQVPPVVEPPQVGQMTRSVLEQTESADAEPDVTATPPGPAATSDGSKVQDLPQEFEGLKFPGDGVLTRQWMEFLNQMTAAK
jgi:hypothetical protein